MGKIIWCKSSASLDFALRDDPPVHYVKCVLISQHKKNTLNKDIMLMLFYTVHACLCCWNIKKVLRQDLSEKNGSFLRLLWAKIFLRKFTKFLNPLYLAWRKKIQTLVAMQLFCCSGRPWSLSPYIRTEKERRYCPLLIFLQIIFIENNNKFRTFQKLDVTG